MATDPLDSLIDSALATRDPLDDLIDSAIAPQSTGVAFGVPGNPVFSLGGAPAAPQPAPGVWNDIDRGLNQTYPDVRRQLGGAMGIAGGILPGALGRTLTQAGNDEIALAGTIPAGPEPTGFAGQAARTVGGMLPAVAAGLAGGPAGFAYGAGVQSGGGQYADVMDRLGPGGEQAATTEGAAMGAVSGVTSYFLPALGLFGRQVPQAVQRAAAKLSSVPAARAALRAAFTGVQEGTQEMLEEGASMLLQRVAEDDPEAWQGWQRRVALAGGLGAIGGVAVHGATGALGARSAQTRTNPPTPALEPTETRTSGATGQTGPVTEQTQQPQPVPRVVQEAMDRLRGAAPESVDLAALMAQLGVTGRAPTPPQTPVGPPQTLADLLGPAPTPERRASVERLLAAQDAFRAEMEALAAQPQAVATSPGTSESPVEASRLLPSERTDEPPAPAAPPAASPPSPAVASRVASEEGMSFSENSARGFSLTVDRAVNLWNDGIPDGGKNRKDAAAALRESDQDVVYATFRGEFKRGANTPLQRINDVAARAGYSVGKIAPRVERGTRFDDSYVVELRKSAPEDMTFQGGKKPWQMTGAEYAEAIDGDRLKTMRGSVGMGGKEIPSVVGRAINEHREIVERAVRDGNAVPPEVLAEYNLGTAPDLTSLTAPQLRAEASRRGLSSVGGRKAVLERLGTASPQPQPPQATAESSPSSSSEQQSVARPRSQETKSPASPQIEPLRGAETRRTSPSDLSSLTVPQLRALARERGLATTGGAKALRERLQATPDAERLAPQSQPQQSALQQRTPARSVAVAAPTNEQASPESSSPDSTRAPAKEPWEMTANEIGKVGFIGSDASGKAFVNTRGGPRTVTEQLRATHEEVVAKAVREGRPVPPHVLAEYPDLKPSAPTPASGKSTRYTSIDPAWHGAEMFAWSSLSNTQLRKGTKLKTDKRPTRSMPTNYRDQLVNVPTDAVRLIDWIKARTPEVWKLDGTVGRGNTLVPKAIVDDAKAAVPDWQTDVDAAKARRKARQDLIWENRQKRDEAAQVKAARDMTPEDWADLASKNEDEAERLAMLLDRAGHGPEVDLVDFGTENDVPADQGGTLEEGRAAEESDQARDRGVGERPTADGKKSDDQGIFGQKTESLTGSPMGLFTGKTVFDEERGRMSPAEEQRVYPGIRKTETIAEYKKRIGTADTIPMFDSEMDVLDKLDRIEQNARDRIKKRQIPRGRGTGAQVLGADLIDAAIIVAMKASRASVKGGRALTKLVNDLKAEFPEKLANADAARIRRVALAIVKQANETGDFDLAAQDARGVAAAPKPTQVKAAVRQATGQTPPDKTVTEPEALKAGLSKAARASREAFRDAAREGKAALKAAVNDVRAEWNERGRNQQKVRDAGVALVNLLPPKVRGSFLTDVSRAETPADLRRVLKRVLYKADTLVAKSYARDAAGLEATYARSVKALDEPRRYPAEQAMRAARDAARDVDAYLKAKPKQRDALRLRAGQAFNTITAAKSEVLAQITEQKNEDVVYALGRKLAADDMRTAQTAVLSKRKDLPALPSGQRNAGVVRTFLRNYSTFRTMMHGLDGNFKDDSGPYMQRFRDLERGDRESKRAYYRFKDAADSLVRKNGYKDISDFLAKTSGTLGEANQAHVAMKLGDASRLSLGRAMSALAHAGDEDTGAAMRAGQRFTFKDSPDGTKFTIGDTDLRAIEAKVSAADRRVVEGLKSLYDRHFFAGLSEVNKRYRGEHLEKRRGYYGIQRAMKQSDNAELAADGFGQYLIRQWQNAGILKQRTGGDAPIVLGDFGLELLERARTAATIIHQTDSIRTAHKTILSAKVREALNATMGKAAIDRIEQTLVHFSGSGPTARPSILRQLMSNTAKAVVASPAAWVRNTTSAALLPSVMEGSLKGLRAVPNLRTTYAEMMREVPELRERWEHGPAHQISMMTATQVSGGQGSTARTGLATLRQLAAATKSLKAGDFAMARFQGAQAFKAYEAFLDTMTIGNHADAVGPAIAYEALKAQAPSGLTDAQKRRWAADRVMDPVNWTVNTNDALNSTGWQLRAKEDSFMASVLQFTSDIAKKQNLIVASFGKSRSTGMKAVAGVAVASVLSAAISAGFEKLLGGDDERAERAFWSRLTSEVASLGPLGSIVDASLQRALFGYRNRGVLDSTLTSLLNDGLAAVEDTAKALESEDDSKVVRLVLRVLSIAARGTGTPSFPYSYADKIVRNAE